MQHGGSSARWRPNLSDRPATVPCVSSDHRYRSGERLPVEVLVFEVDPEHVEEFLAVDHEVWTLGEAYTEGFDHIPFLSKEVWLDDAHPGRITLTFVWESIESWQRVGDEQLQQALQARFDERFPHPVTLVGALHEDSDFGIHRVSRFERIDPADVSDATGR
jgi:uncharacterized protein (TIGR03792 family)